MKFGQLIENNMRNIFLKHFSPGTKCGGETVCPEIFEVLLDRLLSSRANENWMMLSIQAYIQ